MTSHTFYKDPEFETLQLHGGREFNPAANTRTHPFCAPSGFVSDETEHAADPFGLPISRTLINNPTVDVFEKRIAALEGGIGAMATSSGLAALFMAISAIADTGDNIISTSQLGGGTHSQFEVLFRRCGIAVKFVPSDSPNAFKRAIDQNTKAVYVESIGHPKCSVAPIPEIAEVAHEAGVPLIVDNTFGAGGYIIRPIEHGADIVVHSTVKWIGGHGATFGGVIIDSGKFKWTESGRFPGFTEPSEGYYGLRFSEAFGPFAFLAKLYGNTLRDHGPFLSPIAAFLLLHGLETLSLRVQRHCDNALALARWLEQHPKVSWVTYLGLTSHHSHVIAKRLLRENAYGSVLSFGVNGDAQTSSLVVKKLKLASKLGNVGDPNTIVIHAATTTHEDLAVEGQQLTSGVTPDPIHVFVGIEHITDIIADFSDAFELAILDNDEAQS